MRDRPNDSAHRTAAEIAAGRKLQPHEVANQLDEDKANNAPRNMSIETRSAHSARHASKAGKALSKLRASLRAIRDARPS